MKTYMEIVEKCLDCPACAKSLFGFECIFEEDDDLVYPIPNPEEIAPHCILVDSNKILIKET